MGSLSGANRLATRSVVVAKVAGSYDAGLWRATLELGRRVRAEAFPDDPGEAAPTILRDAVERLCDRLCVFMELPRPALVRTPMGDASRDTVLLPGPQIHVIGVLRLAIEMLATAAAGPSSEDAVDRLRDRLLEHRRLALIVFRGSRGPLVKAAIRRNMPWRFLSFADHLLQFGEGRRARRLAASGSTETREVALSLASDKRTGSTVLRRAGLPVARQAEVASPGDVMRLAAEVGYPLVIKPYALRRQTGIRFVYRPEQIEAELKAAASHGVGVVAESFLPGPEHRVLVLDGRVIGAFERPAPQVVGDGRSTIAQLAAVLNGAGRGERHQGFALHPVLIDEQSHAFLESRGWSVDSVPPPGAVVETHPLPFVGFGGGARLDSTERIHPDNHALAARALAALDLDLGGIDLRIPDISLSWREVGAGICEVNPRPDLGAHYLPGLDRDVAGIVLDRRGPPDGHGRMPHILVVGDGDLAERARAIAEALHRAFGWKVGLATGDGVWLGHVVLPADRWAGLATATLFVEDPTLDAAVLAIRRDLLFAEGAGTEHPDLVLTEPEVPGSASPVMGFLRAAGARILPLPATAAAAADLAVAGLRRFRIGLPPS
ncbi:D-alanine-D-alanine ligase-like ATP-grasp enzyme [Stella humosa]|uniref:D-alanine-D-alanine ligase-like ATP-grasp enzyme n=1 Tax=Stella humosa TaxID=94 RepID=A0A3N1MBU0_9PROT|nr:hypothetical protein [Stella humosa]ROQ01193.1 D-alanine-D-alanine ligase-like ATP-grasp enzyme [Stella humosa]BBK31567.1 hypothetical protein STHU_22010 [Stella humosa]